jgi:hypothetical protein
MSRLMAGLRPDQQIYLLVHVVLFTGGVIIAQVGGNALWVAVGTSVAATGITGWVIFLWIRATDRSTEDRERLARVGIVTAFPARSVPIRSEYERRFNASRGQIDYLGFGLRALREDFLDQFPRWLQHTKIRVLLVDPTAPHTTATYVSQRDLEEGNAHGSIESDVKAFLTAYLPIKQQFPDRFQVRLYSSIPALNICRIDDEIFWGPYFVWTLRLLRRRPPVGRSGRQDRIQAAPGSLQTGPGISGKYGPPA